MGAAVVMLMRQGRFLLLRRSGTDPRYPLWWGLPGGKIEDGERPADAAVRETQEETGISISPLRLKPLGVHDEDGYKVHLFSATTLNRHARLRDGEHDRYAWITPREIPCYQTLPLVEEAAKHVT